MGLSADVQRASFQLEQDETIIEFIPGKFSPSPIPLSNLYGVPVVFCLKRQQGNSLRQPLAP